MSRKPNNAPIACQFFIWRLLQRDGVYYADGRTLGKHSLGTRDRDEALANLRLLDSRKAAELGARSKSGWATPTRRWSSTIGTCGARTLSGRCSKWIFLAAGLTTNGPAALLSCVLFFGSFNPRLQRPGDMEWTNGGDRGEQRGLAGPNGGREDAPAAVWEARFVPVFVPVIGTNKNAFRKALLYKALRKALG